MWCETMVEAIMFVGIYVGEVQDFVHPQYQCARGQVAPLSAQQPTDLT